MNMKNQVCMICRQKNDTIKLHKLKNLQRMLKGRKVNIPTDRECNMKFRWRIQKTRCKYGVSCDILQSNDIECQDIIDVIIPLLIGVAEGDDEYLYHMAIQQLRGDFPDAYRQMEMLHSKSRMARQSIGNKEEAI